MINIDKFKNQKNKSTTKFTILIPTSKIFERLDVQVIRSGPEQISIFFIVLEMSRITGSFDFGNQWRQDLSIVNEKDKIDFQLGFMFFFSFIVSSYNVICIQNGGVSDEPFSGERLPSLSTGTSGDS